MDESDPTGLFEGAAPVPGAWSPYSGSMMDAASAFGEVENEAVSQLVSRSETEQLYLNVGYSYNGGPVNWAFAIPLGSWMFGGMGGDGMGGIFMPHTKGKRPSTKGPHEDGMARWEADAKKKEKGDKIRAEQERLRAARKTGVSTRDPDGSLKRAREAQDAEREAQEMAEQEQEQQEMNEMKEISILEELGDSPMGE